MSERVTPGLHIGFRVDGDDKIGLGHVMRSLALAEAFANKKNLSISFIICKNRKTKELIEERGFTALELKSSYVNLDEEINDVVHLIRESNISIIITDSYRIDDFYLGNLRSHVELIITIEGRNNNLSEPDILINYNLFAKKLYSMKEKVQSQKLLLGPKYTLFRKEFINSEKVSHLQKEHVKKILVTFGGTDPFNLTELVIKSLAPLLNNKELLVIIGEYFTQEQKHRLFQVCKNNNNIKCYYQVKDMSKIMNNADLALCAGGTTLFELAYFQIPALATIIADNQIKMIESFADKNVIINLGHAPQLTEEKIVKEIDHIIQNKSLRNKMGFEGRKLVDGKGSERCVDKILEIWTNKNNV